MLHISRNTLDLWWKRLEQTGDCQAITEFQTGSQQKITDWDRFRTFVQQHGGKTQAQMTQLWGDNVSQQNISDAWMAALCQRHLIAPLTFAGSCNRDLFELWLEQCLLPQLRDVRLKLL